MLLFKVSLLFAAGLFNVLVALAVLLRGARKLTNVSFFGLSIAMAGWTIGIGFFLLSQQRDIAFFWAKFYYFCPIFIIPWLAIFVNSFPDRNKMSLTWFIPALIGFLLLAVPLIFVKGFVTEQLVYHDWGKEIVLNRSDYLLYSIYLLVFFPLSLYRMYRISRLRRGVYGAQAELFFYGFLIALIFGVFFNLFLPWLGNYRMVWVGPLFTSSFIIAVAYSIIKHRMFDIRLVIARSAAYVLSLAAFASIYGFIIFGLSQYVLRLDLSVRTQVFLSATSGVASLAFSSLKKHFDRLTNRLFYRDAYDPQEFFNDLNKVLVSTVDLDTLLHRTSDTVVAHLKTEYCLVGLRERKGKSDQRVFGTTQKTFTKEEISQVRRLTPRIPYTVIVTDNIEGEHDSLRNLLLRNNISVLVRLSFDPTNGREGLGYIVLGPKKSGNPYSSQDISVLEAAANELIIAIQNAMRFEEIKQFNLTLQERVDEATKKLRRTNERLRLLDQTKDDFISMASHQLRTPLTSVKGYVSMVLDGDAGKITELQRKLLTQSFLSAQRMVYLISDLLNVSRLKTGKFVIEPVESNLANVIEEEVEQLTETVKSRGLELNYHKPEHFPTLMVDETKLRQVIMNFIDNAVYYTPTGGHINVYLVEKPESIEFTVVDDGIGVPKHEQHHLFTKFYRAKNAQSARPDGTGLGIFMAKKVIVAQGGAIVFKSTEGKGSTFGFTFPKAKLLPSAAPQTDQAEKQLVKA